MNKVVNDVVSRQRFSLGMSKQLSSLMIPLPVFTKVGSSLYSIYSCFRVSEKIASASSAADTPLLRPLFVWFSFFPAALWENPFRLGLCELEVDLQNLGRAERDRHKSVEWFKATIYEGLLLHRHSFTTWQPMTGLQRLRIVCLLVTSNSPALYPAFFSCRVPPATHLQQTKMPGVNLKSTSIAPGSKQHCLPSPVVYDWHSSGSHTSYWLRGPFPRHCKDDF